LTDPKNIDISKGTVAASSHWDSFDPGVHLSPAVLLNYAIEPESNAGPENRLIFVGYPYVFSKDDYRGVFTAVAEEHDVSFSFADEKLTNKHILAKIESMMKVAALSLFDITLWNPNVALELGLAHGLGLDYYILFNPTKGDQEEVLADLRGIDRIEYTSFSELKKHLSKLVRDQFGASEQESKADGIVAQLENLRGRVPGLLMSEPGLPIGGIASSLGVPIELAKTIVRPLIGTDIEAHGVRRGTRYYLVGEAPPVEEDEVTDASSEIATASPKFIPFSDPEQPPA